MSFFGTVIIMIGRVYSAHRALTFLLFCGVCYQTGYACHDEERIREVRVEIELAEDSSNCSVNVYRQFLAEGNL